MAAGVAVSIAIPNQYISCAVIRSSAGEPQVEAMLKETLSVPALSATIRREGLYSGELNGTPIEDLAARLRRRVKVQVAGAATTLEHSAMVISVFDNDRAAAQRINRGTRLTEPSADCRTRNARGCAAGAGVGEVETARSRDCVSNV
jgi:hypothetical protein